MSLSYTITSFCIDVSPPMGAKRTITEEVEDAYDTDDRSFLLDNGAGPSTANGPSSSTREPPTHTRTMTDLEWVSEYVARKVQSCILSELKTAKVHLLLYGSNETNNGLLTDGKAKEGYEGINEIFDPAQADLGTLESIRNLRPMAEDDGAYEADPLDAIICALTTLNEKSRGGVDKAARRFRRTIYVITSGQSHIHEHNADLVKQEIIDSGVAIKVIGIDFDDPLIGFKEENKSPIKAKAETFWHKYLEGIPGSAVASASRVLAESNLPAIQLKDSAPFNTMLSFGDLHDRDAQQLSLRIPVKMYKATAIVRPIGATQISKISQKNVDIARQGQSSSASPNNRAALTTPTKAHLAFNKSNGTQDSPSKIPHYKVERAKRYYVREDLEHLEGGINSAEALPEDAAYERAYKLGATLVTITDEVDAKMETREGIEIIQYTHARSFRRYFNMGEASYVFASDNNVRAQGQFSSLVQSMVEQGKYAIVRHVRRDNTDPKIGILAPQPYDPEKGFDYEGLYYCEMPFRQDYTRHHMEPLNRAITLTGEETTEHAQLPTQEMYSLADRLLDKGDLSDAGEDEDGEPTSWFATEMSYNPAIHNTRDALARRVFKPQDRVLPKPHPEVTKYLTAPEKVVQRSKETMQKCQDLFDLSYGATSLRRRNRARLENGPQNERPAEEPKEIDLGGAMDEELAAEQAASGQALSASNQRPRTPEASAHTPNGLRHQSDPPVTPMPASRAQPTPANAEDSGSETEEEEDGNEDAQGTAATEKGKAVERQADQRVEAVANAMTFDVDDPVADFERKLTTPSLNLEEVIDAMGRAIENTVSLSFGSNNYAAARDMLKAMRKGAIEYEEPNRFNSFLRAFKTRMLEGGSNEDQSERPRPDFWDDYIRGRDDLGLITDREAIGETTKVTTRAAAEFINL